LADFTWQSNKEGVILATKLAGGVRVVLQAENARRQSTGLHAKVTLALAEVDAKGARPIVSDTFNVDKESYRHDFVNILYGVKGRREPKFSDEFSELYPRKNFVEDLFYFCEHFYAELVGKDTGGWVTGDREKSLPQFWVDGLVLKDGGTLLYAPPKSGKSNTGLLMAQSIHAGVCSIFKVEKTIPLYINLERGAKSMSRRLGLVNRVLGLPAEHPLLMLNKRGRTLADVYDIAKAMITEHGVNVVFLDSLSRAGVGDMNANDKSNSSMDLMNALSPSWVALGHTPRDNATHVYGSVMFDAAMDIGINARSERKDDGTLGVGLIVQEANDTGHPPMRILAYEFDAYGLKGVRSAKPSEFPKIEESVEGGESRGGTNAERIYDELTAFGKRTQAELSDELRINIGTVSGVLTSLMEEGKVSRSKESGHFVYFVRSKFEGQT
jgi:hypothetical protein